MKGYRFYKEYNTPQDKRKDRPNGNVFATCLDERPNVTHDGVYIGGFGAVFFDPDSPCAYTSCSLDWLRENCKRISEAEARKIHPNLFKRIEE